MFYSLVHGSPSEYCITMTDRLHKKQKELEDFTEERKKQYIGIVYRYDISVYMVSSRIGICRDQRIKIAKLGHLRGI